MKNDILAAIGTRIAEIRRYHKVTQESLADLLGVSPKHISHVKNATSSLLLKNLIQFCTIFDCSLDYIILGKQSNKALAELPDEIVKILSNRSSHNRDRLKRYLQFYIELQDKQD